MRSHNSHSPNSSPSTHALSSPSSSSSSHTLSESMMDEMISTAEAIISQWDLDSSTFCRVTPLFSDNNRSGARDFLRCVKHLQRAMRCFNSSDNSHSDKLVHAQRLMQTAMKRLQKEFHDILSAVNHDLLNPDNSAALSSSSSSGVETDYGDDLEFHQADDTICETEHEASNAVADLRCIADCMISSGYGRECVHIYKTIRKSIIDESIYQIIGFEPIHSHKLQKLDWDAVELKIKNWVHALKVAVTTLFPGERSLCDGVFLASGAVSESCFVDVSKDAALALFNFPESIVSKSKSKSKRSPEKMFRYLDMYEAIANLYPEIESVFSYESTSSVRSQAVSSLAKLGETIRATLADFESAIQKDPSRSPIPVGGLHPLTRYVMNYLCFLGDYSRSLTDIFAGHPVQIQGQSPPEALDDSPQRSLAVRIEWLIFLLFCKLDAKASLCDNVPLSCLFLANNLQYAASKIRNSDDLRSLLGGEFASKLEGRVRRFAWNFERMGWTNVVSSLPANPTQEMSVEDAAEVFRRFHSAFDAAYREQKEWMVVSGEMRDDIRISIARKIVPSYRAFYQKYRRVLRLESDLEVLEKFGPEDLENYLSDLFNGSGLPDSDSNPGRGSQ